jgi:hypothetical protein
MGERGGIRIKTWHDARSYLGALGTISDARSGLPGPRDSPGGLLIGSRKMSARSRVRAERVGVMHGRPY